MIETIDKTWVDFYHELAEKLVYYQDKRNELIEIINNVYKTTGINLPTLDSNKEMIDIDPFTIFALFNKGSMRNINKIKILTEFASYFDIKSKVPTSFDSIPTVNNQNATYYNFKEYRNEDDIDKLWELFINALNYAKDPSKGNKVKFIESFNESITKSGNGNSKLTGGLYWIAPKTFSNFDKWSIWYIFDTNKLPRELIKTQLKPKGKLTGEHYLELIDMVKTILNSGETNIDNFVDLSHEAWRYSKEVNKSVIKEKEDTKYGKLSKDTKQEVDDVIYGKQEFLNEVFINESNYDRLVQLLQRKKNVILQGPPGVGKTFAAKRLAYSIIGSKKEERIKLVQFHQSYSYEDFIMGYRPNGAGFELTTGAFYDFCKKAENDRENAYFFIIDEINRGNLSKIFGELFMLIENDKRDEEMRLLYKDEPFSVPSNIYIIGMMNTADRSLAILDYALRRRFVFYNMQPAFNTIKFKNYLKAMNNIEFELLIQCIEDLNNEITQDDMLGKGFVIGHSYFSNMNSVTKLEISNIVEYEIIPLLDEYWFDEPSKVDFWSEKLRNVIK